MQTNNTQREVNLIDIVKNVCSKWKYILVVAIIVTLIAVVFDYIQYMKESKKQQSIVQNPEQNVSENVELTEEELAVVTTYYEYQGLLQHQKTYNETSPLMNLDATGFYKTLLCYYVDNYYAVEYPTMNKTNNLLKFTEAYKSVLTSANFKQKLVEILGGEEKAGQYYTEVVDCNNQYGHNIASSQNNGNLMVISIYNADEEMCKKIAGLVKEAIETNKSEITNTFGEHDIALVSENCSLVADNNLVTYQRAKIDNLYNIQVAMDNMVNNMTPNEKIYIDNNGKQAVSNTQVAQQENAVVTIPPYSIKTNLIVIAFVAGAFIAAFWFMLRYLFVTKLQKEDDFEKIYQVKTLGKIGTKQSKNNGERKTQVDFEEVRMIATSIQILAKQEGVDTIFLTGEQFSAMELEIVEQLKSLLSKNQIKLEHGESVMTHVDSFTKAADLGHVVLMETVNKSKYKEIKQIIDKLQYHKIKIMGSIIVSC